MKKLLVPVAGLGLLFGAVATAAPAAADAPGTSSAQIVGVVKQTGPTTAEVQVRYSCTGSADQVHLWTSVKQTTDRTADPLLAQEGSSGYAAAWSQSHSVEGLVCDGHTHVGRFAVDQREMGFGRLGKGEAWVQFCLFDATTGEVPVSSMEFVHVR